MLNGSGVLPAEPGTFDIDSTSPAADAAKGRELYVLQPGMKVHFYGWTDVYPGTVIEVNGKHATVREAKAEYADGWEPNFVPGGFSAHCTNQALQKWNIADDESGDVTYWTRRKDGTWHRKGRPMSDGVALREGWRKFHDFNF